MAIPLVGDNCHNYRYILQQLATYLALYQVNSSLSPFYIDFFQGKSHQRVHFSQGRKHPLARAVGLKGQNTPQIIDTTAGMGTDAYFLSSLGCPVLMIERHPIIAALLEDGLQRLYEVQPKTTLSLLNADARDYLVTLPAEQYPEVIYLDPMFPERPKSALVKKDMQILKDIMGEDVDADDLLLVALQHCTQRIVVKRPQYAPSLGVQQPDFSIKTRRHRYDVYLIKPLKNQ